MPKVKTKDQGKKVEVPQDAELAARVEKLEQDVRELRQLSQLRTTKPDDKPFSHDWEATFGIFKDDPTFDEAIRLGREWRRRQPKCGYWIRTT